MESGRRNFIMGHDPLGWGGTFMESDPLGFGTGGTFMESGRTCFNMGYDPLGWGGEHSWNQEGEIFIVGYTTL